MDQNIATHQEPAWRSRADFLIFANLSDWDLDGRWEQIWAQKITNNEFMVCCIPFFTYDIHLGDHVVTAPRSGENYVITTVTLRAARKVYRIWFGEAVDEILLDVESFLRQHEFLHEWSSRNLLAVDVPEGPLVVIIDKYLEALLSTSAIKIEQG